MQTRTLQHIMHTHNFSVIYCFKSVIKLLFPLVSVQSLFCLTINLTLSLSVIIQMKFLALKEQLKGTSNCNTALYLGLWTEIDRHVCMCMPGLSTEVL